MKIGALAALVALGVLGLTAGAIIASNRSTPLDVLGEFEEVDENHPVYELNKDPDPPQDPPHRAASDTPYSDQVQTANASLFRGRIYGDL